MWKVMSKNGTKQTLRAKKMTKHSLRLARQENMHAPPPSRNVRGTRGVGGLWVARCLNAAAEFMVVMPIKLKTSTLGRTRG